MFGNKLEKVASAIEKGKEGALLKLVGDKDKSVQLAAIAGLGKIGKDDGFNLMVPLLTSEDADLRAAAALALGEMKNDHASAHLRYHLEKETDAKVKEAMKEAITKLGGSQ